MNYLGSILSIKILPANLFSGDYTLENVQNLDFEEISPFVSEGATCKCDGKDSDAGIFYENEITLTIAGITRFNEFLSKNGNFYTCLISDPNDAYYLIAPQTGLQFMVSSGSIPNRLTSRPDLSLSFRGSDLFGAIPIL